MRIVYAHRFNTATPRKGVKSALAPLSSAELPLLFDPLASAQRRLVGAGVAPRQPGGYGHLLYKRGLADLARTGEYLDEAAALAQTPRKHLAVGRENMIYDLLNTMRRFTQHRTQTQVPPGESGVVSGSAATWRERAAAKRVDPDQLV